MESIYNIHVHKTFIFRLLNTEMQPNFTTVNTIGPVFMRAELGGIPAACLYMTNSTTRGH